jgi:hypothetical protein
MQSQNKSAGARALLDKSANYDTILLHMKNKGFKYLVLIFALLGVIMSFFIKKSESFFFLHPKSTETAVAPAVKPAPARPKYVRGIHLTSWITGSLKHRPYIDDLLTNTEINMLVIDIKEYEGEVYVPGVPELKNMGIYVNAIPDLKDYLAKLKSRGVYTIARIVVFKDNLMPRKKPELAVKNSEGGIWMDRRGLTWLDPYRKESWDYNIAIAEQAVDMGFDEIQFDYIRFPTDGNIKDCRYSQAHTTTTSAAALIDFLQEANKKLKAKGVNISIDVFGLTTTVTNDMGIGQHMVRMAQWVDYVSPMVYPSHYNKGEYGMPDPNLAPYKTVFLALEGAKKKFGGQTIKIRPWLQDFSLGSHYGKNEVLAQIQACYDNDIGEWILWNPRCVYTRTALKEKKFSGTYQKSENPNKLLGRVRPSSTTVRQNENTVQ